MELLRNYDLSSLNTLGVHAQAKEFVEIQSEEDLKELFDSTIFKQNKKVFLGGGSNVLFTKDFDGLVILNKLKGIEMQNFPRQGLGKDKILIRAMSGEVWHDLVLYTAEKGYWGIENLAFIPGTVGGAPVQNIGAYGAELKNVLENVEAYRVKDGVKKVFSAKECEFGYRDSVFKNRLKGEYFIGAVTLRLSKIPQPNLSYKILREYLKANPPAGGEVKSPKDISDAVTKIRADKLPDPKILSNAGSFFKNVFVNEEQLKNLLKFFPDLKYFKEGRSIKISAGWLIEHAGWKGKRIGNVGVHDKHALILVNYGGGTGAEIKGLAEQIMDSVFDKFKIKLVPEVNLI